MITDIGLKKIGRGSKRVERVIRISSWNAEGSMDGRDIGKVKLSNILFNHVMCIYIYIYMRVYVCVYRVSRVDRRSSISQDQVVPTFHTLFGILMLSRFKERGGVSRFRNAWLICALTSSGPPMDPALESNLHLAHDATPFSNFETILFKIYIDA